jgi:hypothetical protein
LSRKVNQCKPLLSGKVTEVYNRCGFDFDPSISTIQMLTNIESKLEQYLGVVAGAYTRPLFSST